MRAQMLVATFVLALAASASAQVLTSPYQPAGSAADLLSRASRMAAEAERRFAKPPAQAPGWAHGSGTGTLRRPVSSR
jgi:hypothetical protein